MAETETHDSSTNVFKVTEEIDGDQIPTRNYRFSKIGEPVPITSDADFKFDMDSLPSRPLAVSERLGLVFIAHLSGFSVARMKDVVDAAEELKNGVEGPCIQELSVVDVPLGKVSILALSADSSMLAASVGLNLYFFSVDGLLHKDHEPSHSKSFSGLSCIKDMEWSSLLEDQYVVLTDDGSLYRGAVQGDLNHVMDNVDAVNWSMNGKFIAVAKDGVLSILSSKFHEKLRIKLLFDSLVDDNPNCVVKVDSVKWVRPDCIVLGCYCLSDDGKEENHLIQFISVKDGKITNPSSIPVASTFRDAFLAINEDDIPSGSGPYTLVSYLDDFEVAFVANKKNTNQHISLFNWSEDGAVMVEIEVDSWLPIINLQVHDDADNMILGLTINKEYKDKKTILECGEIEQKVPPCCILMCVTVDGRFCMFHFASAIGPSALSEDFSSVSDEEEPQVIDSQHPVINIVNDERQIGDQGHQKAKTSDQKAKTDDQKAKIDDQKVKTDDQKAKIDFPKVKADDLKAKIDDQKVKINDQKVKVNEPSGMQQGVLTAKPNNGRDEGQSFLIPKKEGSFEPAVNSVSKATNDTHNKSPFQVSTELPVNKPLFASSGTFSSGPLFSSNVFGVQSSSSSGSFSSGGLFSSSSLNIKSPQPSYTAVQEKQDTSLGTTPKFSFSKMTSGSSTSSNLLSQGASAGAAFTKSLPVSNAQPSLSKSPDFKIPDNGNFKNQTSSRLSNTESNQSEQHSVKEMAKELDALLDSIVKPGGFYYASVTAHKQSVAELQEGISVLSDRCQKWTDKMHQGCEEVQHLLDKTVQVLARKIYIEAIVKQSTDSQYLDIWNHQKLNSELDMKRRHILDVNQNLTKQLIELERHLNTLELQRFGAKGDSQISRKSSHMKHNPPRHIQSLHSLQNTMNAQLTAAEKLSECLSKQMAVLNIETEPKKKQNVKKELFDTIGISYDDTAFSSPSQEKSQPTPPKSQHLVSSYSKKSQQGALKISEPETARRRIDSLDKSWASIEPPKTTVKRMLLQDDRQMSPARLSLPAAKPKPNNRLHERSVVSHDIPHGALNMPQIRAGQDVQTKRNSEEQLNSSLWGNYRSDSLSSGSQSAPVVTLDAAKETHNLTAEKSNRLTFTLKSDASLVKDPKFSQQSKSSPEPSLNTVKLPAFSTFQKMPSEYSESNPKPILGETSTIWSRKGTESSAVLSSSSSTAFSGKSFSLEASTRESQSSSAALPVPVISAPASFSFKDTTSSSTSAMSFSKSSTGFGFKLGSTQTTPSSGLSYSFPSFSSTTTSTKPTLNIDLNTSKSEPSKLNPDTSESSKPQVVSVPKFDPKPSQALPQPVTSTPSGPASQPSPSFLSFPSTTSSAKPTLNVDLNTLKSEPFKLNLDTSESSKLQVVSFPKCDPKPNESPFSQTLPSQPVTSAPSGPTSQPSSSTISESHVSLNSKPDQPSVSPAVSSPITINPVDVASGQTNESDLTQEDEMEEEAPDTTQFTLGNLGGFGLGSSPSPNPSAPKQNPFGAPFGNTPASAPIPSFTSLPGGGLFKPASFNVESQQPSQPSQQTSFGGVNIFGGGNNQSSGGQGFGQPARIGSGQQALGSVLGSFGQSRQFGAVLPGSVASSNPFGSGFGSSQTSGGFATASSGGGGFAGLASGGGGGFAAAATGGSGFATAATGTGGFGGAPTTGGGFGAPAALGGGPVVGGGFGGAPGAGGGFGGAPGAGGGFAGVTPGGFGAFSGQGGSGFSTFGGGGTGKPPSELFTQMRK